jgi:hypothetical protein
LKVNGSLARVAMRHLEKEGLIKRIVHHSDQLIYSGLSLSCRVVIFIEMIFPARLTTASD